MNLNDKIQCNEDIYYDKIKRYSKIVKSLIIIIILIIFACIILISLYCIARNVGYVYAMMIDAGSTSSKVSILRWRDWPFRTNGWVEELMLKRVTTGISAYGMDPSEAFKKLKPTLTELMSNYVPAKKLSNTGIYLGATAGMRMLKLESPLQSEAILEDLRRNLPTIGVRLRNAYSDVRIISGSYEGRFAWVSTNYLAKKFGTENGFHTGSVEETIGALDLGGASTQIAFVPGSDASGTHIAPISLFGQTYNLYSYSYLCYGVEMAKNRVWASILQNAFLTPPSDKTKIENPCLPKDYIMKIKKSEIFIEPCVISKFAKQLVDKEIIPPNDLPNELTFVGSWDFDKCKMRINELFIKTKCYPNSCSFKGIYRPKLKGKFYAMSAFWFVYDFLGFSSDTTSVTKIQYENKVKTICAQTWDKIKQNRAENTWKFVSQNCFVGIFVHELLVNYGFLDDESWMSISFVNKVSGGSVSWALGYIIDATGDIKSRAPKIHLPISTFSVIVAILAVLLIVLIICLLLYKLNKLQTIRENLLNFI